jgi:hypothetical protein
MNAFRLYLLVAWIALQVYSAMVGQNHSLDQIGPEFNSAVAAMTWQGQMNVDFAAALALSGLWAGWRNGWSLLGWVLGIACFVAGTTVSMAYLLFLTYREKGDMKRVLLGVHADETPHRRWTD